MPELPDITVYAEALEARVVGTPLLRVLVSDPFVLRTAAPPIDSLVQARITSVSRLGKRLVFAFEGNRWLVLHLMVAGRLHWAPQVGGTKTKAPRGLASFHFPNGVLTLSEAGTQRRASLHVVTSPERLAAHNPGGLEVAGSSLEAFRQALTRENHTLKRALTDPHLFSGIGNAYSDEILHAAGLSPVTLSQKLDSEEVERLHRTTQRVLAEWTDRLRRENRDQFPSHVTAFRPGMAVHGRFGQPCPVCQTAVQRIRYAANEVNYCPRCQTEGKLLADRSLSRLLKSDWPRSIDEAEARRDAHR
ncbi:MAG: formamidopyrimidine-DNA glycosylase [Opitutaceae bacterium]|nr:formamidopyrimidine-DNA glycosylase [Opitutaceae bacterium]